MATGVLRTGRRSTVPRRRSARRQSNPRARPTLRPISTSPCLTGLAYLKVARREHAGFSAVYFRRVSSSCCGADVAVPPDTGIVRFAAPARAAHTAGCRRLSGDLGPQAWRISCAGTSRPHRARGPVPSRPPTAASRREHGLHCTCNVGLAAGRQVALVRERGGYFAQRHAAGLQFLGQRHDVGPSLYIRSAPHHARHNRRRRVTPPQQALFQ